MTFMLPDHWVWDFWFARDGDTHHMYYLQAPTSLGDPDLRHRNATIGHATSADLRTWTVHGTVLKPSGGAASDATATWTGSVVRDAEIWRMFYTGSRFLDPAAHTNVETVLAASASEPGTWTKDASVVVAADPRWYETLGDGTWHEQAWRDPWVFADPAGDGWHMLVTARALGDGDRDAGVIGHARSDDLLRWEVGPPLSIPGAGFAHLEVPQLVLIDGRWALIFSCDSAHLAGARTGARGGIWAVALDDPLGPYPVDRAVLVASEKLYSGRITQDAAGRDVMLAFENVGTDGVFVGALSDPLPVRWENDRLIVEESAA
ncbi:hypothetical protein GCM10027058_08090 [Microbacterium neimengense]